MRRTFALLACLLVLAFAPCAAIAANLLIVTTAEDGFDGGAGVNIVENFIRDIPGSPANTVTINRGGLTNGTLNQAYFSGYDMVFVISVYKPIAAGNVNALAAAMANNGSAGFVLFIDTCGACDPQAGAKLSRLVNTVAPATWGVGVGPMQSGNVSTTLNISPPNPAATANPYAGGFSSKPVFLGVAYTPFTNVPTRQHLYQDGSLAYMISIPRVESPTRTCLIASSDTSGFANIPGVVVHYPSNAGIGTLLVNAVTQPSGMCNAINLRLRKALPDGRLAAADQFRLSIVGASTSAVNTTGTGTTATGEVLLQATSGGSPHAFSEAMAVGSGSALTAYSSTYTCTNAAPNSTTVMPSGATGTSFSITPAFGDNITCVFTNTSPRADLFISKTNTIASGITDQSGDTVTSGATTTYTITVRNAGPSNVTNAVVRDSAGAGLTNCSVPTTPSPKCSVTSGTATCPTDTTLTYANLSASGGVTIPLMSAGSTIQFQVSCTVN